MAAGPERGGPALTDAARAESRSLRRRWRALERRTRVIGAIVAVVVAVNVLLLALGLFFPSPGGPRSSSYATAPEGLAAYATLLRDNGYGVSAALDAPTDDTLDPRSTVVLLDPDTVLEEEAQALGRFVERGGRLVAGGPDPAWLTSVLDRPPEWSPEGLDSADLLAPVPETAGVARIAAGGTGSWKAAGSSLPALGDDTDRSLLVVGRAGAGSFALLADASPLHNERLGSDDNAALGLALAGSRDRPVTFVETVHGYGAERGLAALPDGWKVALAGLALAGLLLMLARGRRLGPPEDEERTLPPPRRAYVDALAASLAKTGQPSAAVVPVRGRGRALVASLAGSRELDDAELRLTGRRIGLSKEEVDALAGEGAGEQDLLAAGRALARLEARRGGRDGTDG